MDGTPLTSADMLLTRVAALVLAMQDHAGQLDQAAAFPVDDIAALAKAGALIAPFPINAGGLGFGTSPEQAIHLLDLLRLLGHGNLSIGRVFEAHVNAVRLIVRYATSEQTASAAVDAAKGHLFALWVTDPGHNALRIEAGRLRGAKEFCSAAGHATRAVVTAEDEAGEPRLMLVDVMTAKVQPLPGALLGMRSAITGRVGFDGLAGATIGMPGDYLREPDFSTGAWRTSAVTLGGLEALASEARRHLVARNRHTDPHQLARMGQVSIAEETARLWMQAAGPRAENADADPASAITYVNLARLAVERTCLDTIELVQRSLGLAAFMRPNPVERICRDLATYLRQPAGDMVLTEAAAHAMLS